jgi:hypothetical protein
MVLPLRAQNVNLRNELGASYFSEHFGAHDDYVGWGVDYRFNATKHFAAEAQIAYSPQYQVSYSADRAYDTGLGDIAFLAGNRWKNVRVSAECGLGLTRTQVYGGLVSGETYAPYRHYVTALFGALVEVYLSHRWSISYEGRDDLTFVPPFQLQGIVGNSQYPRETLNIPEGRVGVSFHF